MLDTFDKKPTRRKFPHSAMAVFLGLLLLGGLCGIIMDAEERSTGLVLALFFLGIPFVYFACRFIWPSRTEAALARRTFRQSLMIYRSHQAAIAVFFISGVLQFQLRFFAISAGKQSAYKDVLMDIWMTRLLYIITFADITGCTKNVWRSSRPVASSEGSANRNN